MHLSDISVDCVGVLPVLRFDEEAEVTNDGGDVSGLTSSAVNIDSVLLGQEMIKNLCGTKNVVSISLRSVQIINRMSHVLDISLAVPVLDLLLIVPSLGNLVVRLETKNSGDTTVLQHPLNIDLVKRIRSENDIPTFVGLTNFVKEESLEEGSISLLDDTVYGLDGVDTTVMRSVGTDFTLVLVGVGLVQESGGLSLDNLVTVRRFVLNVRIEKAQVLVWPELTTAVGWDSIPVDFALVKGTNRFAILASEPVLVVIVHTIQLQGGKSSTLTFLAELHLHAVTWLIKRIEHGEANLILLSLIHI